MTFHDPPWSLGKWQNVGRGCSSTSLVQVYVLRGVGTRGGSWGDNCNCPGNILRHRSHLLCLRALQNRQSVQTQEGDGNWRRNHMVQGTGCYFARTSMEASAGLQLITSCCLLQSKDFDASAPSNATPNGTVLQKNGNGTAVNGNTVHYSALLEAPAVEKEPILKGEKIERRISFRG